MTCKDLRAGDALSDAGVPVPERNADTISASNVH
jgi:hypothetical protein